MPYHNLYSSYSSNWTLLKVTASTTTRLTTRRSGDLIGDQIAPSDQMGDQIAPSDQMGDQMFDMTKI